MRGGGNGEPSRASVGAADPAAAAPSGARAPVLEVRDLRTTFATEEGEVRAVDGVSFTLREGESLGLVGESGCGKSVTALSLLRLVDGRIEPGSRVRLRGEDLLSAPESRLREIRGAEIAMVFQEPMTSLNPVLPVGEQIAETLRHHRGLRGPELWDEVEWLMERVGLPEPPLLRRRYPHQLSGGMRQRAMIAMAVACRPAVLVADEPTTALDVTVQAQILELLRSLQEEFRMAVLLISHDLGVVARLAHRVAVMYAGQIVEMGSVPELFRSPGHPYTEGLLLAAPDVERPRHRLAVIPGQVPHPTRWPEGCRFHPRCPYAWDRCRATTPPLLQAPVSQSRCWLTEDPGRRTGRGFHPIPTPPPGPAEEPRHGPRPRRSTPDSSTEGVP